MINRVFARSETIRIHLYPQRVLNKKDTISKTGWCLKQKKTKQKDKNKIEVMMFAGSNYVYLCILL